MQTIKKYKMINDKNRKVSIIFDEEKDKERILAHKRVCEYNNKKYERIDGLIAFCSMSPIIIFLSGFLIYCLSECFDIKIIVGLCVLGVGFVLIIFLAFRYIDKLKSYAGSSFQMEACDKKIKEINNLSMNCNNKCKVGIKHIYYQNFLYFFVDGVEKFSFRLDSEIPDGDFYVVLKRCNKEDDCCVHHIGDFKWVAVTSLSVEDNCDIKDVRMQTEKDVDNIFEESIFYKLKKKIVSF